MLAKIAAKIQNGVGNPWAQLRKEFGYEFCRDVSEKNPIVAGPLKRTDCSLVSDGAARGRPCRYGNRVNDEEGGRFRSRSQNDYLPMGRRDMSQLEGCANAWANALSDES